MSRLTAFSSLLILTLSAAARGQEALFSGPQRGEKLTGFRCLEVIGARRGTEVDYVTEAKGAPVVLVFLHGVERSMVPLINAIEGYVAENRPAVQGAFVLLSGDRAEGERRLQAVGGSLRPRIPMGLSLDGAEGPGNYGLNSKCLMTVVIGKDAKAAASFALVQPGIADAPKVLTAIAGTLGKPAVAAEEVQAVVERAAAARAAGGDRPARDPAQRRPAAPAPDLSRFDLNTPEGVRDALRALIAEVTTLRQQIDRLRAAEPARPAEGDRTKLPGASPRDPKLQELLRATIRPTNTKEDVHRVIRETEEYAKTNPELTKQVVDMYELVLHLKYGTEYAQQAMRQQRTKLAR